MFHLPAYYCKCWTGILVMALVAATMWEERDTKRFVVTKKMVIMYCYSIVRRNVPSEFNCMSPAFFVYPWKLS